MRFVTCRLPDGVEDPAILSPDGTQVWPLRWTLYYAAAAAILFFAAFGQSAFIYQQY